MPRGALKHRKLGRRSNLRAREKPHSLRCVVGRVSIARQTHEPACAGINGTQSPTPCGQNPASAASSSDVLVRRWEPQGRSFGKGRWKVRTPLGPEHPRGPHLLKPSAADRSGHQQPQCDWAEEAHARVSGQPRMASARGGRLRHGHGERSARLT